MEKKELQEFLYFLTHNKGLTRAQQLKRDALLARDYMEEGDRSFLGNLESINIHSKADHTPHGNIEGDKSSESQVPIEPESESVILSQKTIDNKEHREGIEEEYISPKNLQRFLRKYNQDKILKYTCHLLDDDEVIDELTKVCGTDGYNYNEHLNLIKRRFKDLRWSFKKEDIRLPSNMLTLINVYLFGHDLNKNTSVRFKGKKETITWSSNHIGLNWSSEEIAKWSLDNPRTILNPGDNIAAKQSSSGYILPRAFISIINGDRIKKFSDLVLFFKSQFHIREDNSLRKILDYFNERWDKKDVQVSYKEDCFYTAIELFTDVDKLIQSYKRIIEICLENRESETEPIHIELSFYENSDNKYFCIHHKNTVYGRTSFSATRMGDHQTPLVRNQINGLCDLFVEAAFKDNKCGCLNLWDSQEELIFKPVQENLIGVKYIMRF